MFPVLPQPCYIRHCRHIKGGTYTLRGLGPCAPNKKGAPKGELTLRTSVITHGSKGELALRGTFFIWCTRALDK